MKNRRYMHACVYMYVTFEEYTRVRVRAGDAGKSEIHVTSNTRTAPFLCLSHAYMYLVSRHSG
jgi:hypothetical protein